MARAVSASTQTQALSALIFLYRHVLGMPFEWLENLTRAKKPARLPVVLTRAEVRAVLERIHGVPRLVAGLLSGSGLRLMEACTLRIKDLDLNAASSTSATLRAERTAAPCSRNRCFRRCAHICNACASSINATLPRVLVTSSCQML